jgi:hypothetical protein
LPCALAKTGKFYTCTYSKALVNAKNEWQVKLFDSYDSYLYLYFTRTVG